MGVRERRESMRWGFCDLEVQSALQRVIEGERRNILVLLLHRLCRKNIRGNLKVRFRGIRKPAE